MQRTAPYNAIMRAIPILALALVAWPTFAQIDATPMLPPTRFIPASTLARFAPETTPDVAMPAYLTPIEAVERNLFHSRPRAALYKSIRVGRTDLGLSERSKLELIRARIFIALGLHERAAQLLESRTLADSIEAKLVRARQLLDLAQPKPAIELLESLRQNPSADAIEIAHTLGRAFEMIGDETRAIETYAAVVEGEAGIVARWRAGGSSAFSDDAKSLTLAADCVVRHAFLTTAFAKDRSRRDAVLAMYTRAFDVIDREYWPARVGAARFLADHHDSGTALSILDQANAIAPRDPELNRLFAEIVLAERRSAPARGAAESIRESDPNSPVAARIEADALIFERRFDAARDQLRTLAAGRPADIDTLARLAAVSKLLGDDAEFARVSRQVRELDADSSAVDLHTGLLFSSFFDAYAAIPFLERAIETSPYLIAPRHALGVALMGEGDEARARDVLEQAYALDPFNVLTVNYLRVIDELADYAEFDGTYVTFRYSKQDDPVVPMVIAPIVDAMFLELCNEFRYTPERKPIVEIMADSQAFSARTVGLPGLETFGASLGRVMTVMPPRRGGSSGPFNWYRVIRHEFTHTLNLMYTSGRVPRWLTEGLATWQEDVPYRFAWVPRELWKRVDGQRVFRPNELDRVLGGGGGGPRDGEIAYMTGCWMARFIDETFGREAIVKLLDAYRDGKADDDAFVHATGLDVAAFYQRFVPWCEQLVADWGYDAQTQTKVDELTDEAKQLMSGRQYEQAIELWKQINALQPMEPLPHQRLAGLYIATNRPADALPHLEATIPVELQDNRFARRIATINKELGRIDDALKYADTAVQIDPYDPAAHALRAELLDAKGNAAEADVARNLSKLLAGRR